MVQDATPNITSSYVLHGLGGIGKTQIAIEYAYRHQKEFDIICWLRADDYNTLISSYIQLANNPTFKSFANLNFNDKPNHKAIAKRVQMWFENTLETRWLLVLDNADSLGSYGHLSPTRSKVKIRAFKALGTLIPKGNGGCVLVTSRSRSAVGEVAESGWEVRSMTEHDAKDLLIKCSKSKHLFDAMALVGTLGRHPLAIEQAGGFIRANGISIAKYRSLFESHKSKALKEGLSFTHQSVYYKHTIASTWEMSFQAIDEIDPLASKLLRLIAFLDGKFIQKELFTKGLSVLQKGL
ncbi:MAG: hypothetical protein E6J34_17640, partial [Chloroflexi bacterium]